MPRPAALRIDQARRIALAAQGFDRPRPAGPVTRAHLRGVIRRLGLLQIDSVNVLVPAHYQVPFSRLGPYDRALLDDVTHGRRGFTEQVAHEACILPVEMWPYFRHRMDGDDQRWRSLAYYMSRHRDYVRRVLDEIRERGPVLASEVAEPDGRRRTTTGWWGWTTAKAVLEGLFASGKLAIVERRTAGFARVYDLAERVVPEEHLRLAVGEEEAQRELLVRAARALGVGTARDLADYYRVPIRAARARLADLAAEGALETVAVEGWKEPAYLHPEARRPRRIDAAALVSPFDPVVWFRPRAERLFGFDYRIEIYTPQPKRRWGYYVLPFLLGERLVARVDLKADRAAKVLRVPAAHLEAHAEAGATAAALADELRAAARWLGLDGVKVERRGNLARTLAAALRK